MNLDPAADRRENSNREQSDRAWGKQVMDYMGIKPQVTCMTYSDVKVNGKKPIEMCRGCKGADISCRLYRPLEKQQTEQGRTVH